MRILVDQTFWIALMDSAHEKHEQSREKFKELLMENHQFYITSHILDEVLFHIRNHLPDKENELVNILFDAIDGNYLKIIHIGRMTYRESVKLWKKYREWPYGILDLANVVIMRKRFIMGILTWRNEYRLFNVNTLNE